MIQSSVQNHHSQFLTQHLPKRRVLGIFVPGGCCVTDAGAGSSSSHDFHVADWHGWWRSVPQHGRIRAFVRPSRPFGGAMRISAKHGKVSRCSGCWWDVRGSSLFRRAANRASASGDTLSSAYHTLCISSSEEFSFATPLLDPARSHRTSDSQRLCGGASSVMPPLPLRPGVFQPSSGQTRSILVSLKLFEMSFG